MPNTPHGGDAEALQRIRSFFPLLGCWGERLAKPFRPAPGSELAADDEDWRHSPLTQHAIASLAVNRVHLQAIRVHIEAGQQFPFATETLLRSAIVGGAQAVWLLSPDDAQVRRGRGRTIAHEGYVRHLQYLDELRKLAPQPHHGTERVHARVTQRLEELTALREAAGERGQLQPTAMIEAAAAHVYGPGNVTEARAIWRAGSGAAHGLQWPLFGRPGTETVGGVGSDGLATYQSTGSFEGMLNGFFLAVGLGTEGWNLLDQRSA